MRAAEDSCVQYSKNLNANLLDGVPDGLTEEEALALVGEEVAVAA